MATGSVNKAKQLVYLTASKNVSLTAGTGQTVQISRSDFTGLLDTDNIVFAIPGLGSGSSVNQDTFMGYGINVGTGTSQTAVAYIRLYSSVTTTVSVTVRILVER